MPPLRGFHGSGPFHKFRQVTGFPNHLFTQMWVMTRLHERAYCQAFLGGDAALEILVALDASSACFGWIEFARTRRPRSISELHELALGSVGSATVCPPD